MKNDTANLPLVSCTVVSYNSAATVLETLESIKNQSYNNIELIVSDDCSTDDTVNLCKDWIEKNKERFVRTELITVDKNTGVCCNCNRALHACRGVWEKGIAADDIMLPNCIEDFVEFVNINPDARWVSSYHRTYLDVIDDATIQKWNGVSKPEFFDLDANPQLKMLAKRNILSACTMLFSVQTLVEIGGFDESFSYEDHPLYIRLLEHGYKCFFMPKETVGYRVHESTLQVKGKIFSYPFALESRKFTKAKRFKYLNLKRRFGIVLIWRIQDFMEKCHLNKYSPKRLRVYHAIENIIYNVFIY